MPSVVDRIELIRFVIFPIFISGFLFQDYLFGWFIASKALAATTARGSIATISTIGARHNGQILASKVFFL